MPVPENKPSSIVTPHLFAHIYATHASKIVEEYIATDQKNKISRAKIELEIIRVLDQDEDLPLKYKLSCTSMILHTDTFEPFWGDQKLVYSLSEKSMKRLKPSYKLIDQLPCPVVEDDSVGNMPGKNGVSRTNSKATNGKRGGPRAAPAKTINGKTPKSSLATKAAANRRKTTIASKAPRGMKTAASNGKPDGYTNGIVQPPPAPARSTGRPVGKTGMEALRECMAKKDDMHVRGPTSDEEETTTDDDSDSESDQGRQTSISLFVSKAQPKG